jgi:hypothetical protein
MFFAPASFHHMSYLEAHEDNANPITFVARADQSAYNFSGSTTDISDLFSSLTCSDTALSDLLNSEASDVRTIDGSSRLFSSDNLVYLLPLGTVALFSSECILIPSSICIPDEEEYQRLQVLAWPIRMHFANCLCTEINRTSYYD